jgi:4-amino-4-deoxychorismate lyase
MLITNGEVQNIAYHQARFERTQKELFGVISDIKLESYIDITNNINMRCKLVYTDIIESNELLPYTKKMIKKLILLESDIEYTYKLADRHELDYLYDKRGAADDIIIVKDGLVCDTTIANLAFFDGFKWLTPKKPLLNGTTRQRLLDEGFLSVADIEAKNINNFKQVAIMNALRGFEIVGSCDSF